MTELTLSISPHPVFVSMPLGTIRLVKEGNKLIVSLFGMVDVEVKIDHPLVITTPIGVLNIHTNSNDRRKALLKFPSGWGIRKEGKEERVLDDFFKDGKPTYLLLAPMVDKDGQLVGVNPIRRENLQLKLVPEEQELVEA